MTLRTVVVTALVPLAVTALVACTSSVIGTGQGSGLPSSPTSSPPSATTSAPPTTASASPSGATPSSTISAVSGAVTPCPESDPNEAFDCLQGVLSAYWSGQLNQVISERIVVDATPAQAPPACRPGIEAGGAITCKDDLTLYIAHPFLALIDSHFDGLDRALVLASVASHEFGHVLQYTLHQPQIEQRRPPDATSQFVEQQADCLSGVWAGYEAGRHDLDANEFVNDAYQLITDVSDNPEIATHGTPPTRRAAIERGLAGGSAGVCDLVTFH